MTWTKALLIALDQLCNALLGGWPDETLSSRCWRWEMGGVRAWPRMVVDDLFFWEEAHCRQSFESERTALAVATQEATDKDSNWLRQTQSRETAVAIRASAVGAQRVTDDDSNWLRKRVVNETAFAIRKARGLSNDRCKRGGPANNCCQLKSLTFAI